VFVIVLFLAMERNWIESAPQSALALSAEERKWAEIRAQRRKVLEKEGVIVVEIKGKKVEVKQGEHGLTWKIGGKVYNTSIFWPDEPIGTVGEYPTFYEVAEKYGLHTYIPAAAWWRQQEARAERKTLPEQEFQPEE